MAKDTTEKLLDDIIKFLNRNGRGIQETYTRKFPGADGPEIRKYWQEFLFICSIPEYKKRLYEACRIAESGLTHTQIAEYLDKGYSPLITDKKIEELIKQDLAESLKTWVQENTDQQLKNMRYEKAIAEIDEMTTGLTSRLDID